MNSDRKAGLPVEGTSHKSETHTQLLLLPDGRLLVHNLTPAMAQILQKLDPGDRLIRLRAPPVTAGAPSALDS